MCIRRIGSFIIACIFSISVIMYTGISPISTSASNTSDIQAEIDALQKEMDSIGADKQEEQEYQNALNKQIDALNAQVDEYQAQLDALNDQINKQSTEVLSIKAEADNLNKEIEKILVQLKSRMRSEYVSTSLSWWEILLSSADLTDFMYNIEYAKRDAEKVQQLKDELDKQVSELNAKLQEEQSKLNEIEQTKSNLVSVQSDIQKTADEVNSKIAQSQDKSKQLSEQYQKTKAKQDEASEQLAQAQAEADAALDSYDGYVPPPSSNSNSNSSSTGFICPLAAGTYYISQYYTPPGHKGVDFATWGKAVPIYASKAGTVVTAQHWNGYSTTGMQAYGNMVQISHGGGDSTLYAHCSSICVSSGQYVEQGQLIGYVGKTGQSTGYHLHYEMKINGSRVDPLKYI